MAATIVIATAALIVGALAGAAVARWRGRRGDRAADRIARRFVDGIPAFGWSTDPAGSFTYVSAGILSFYGVGADTFLPARGENGTQKAERFHRTMIHPEDASPRLETWRRALATGTPFRSDHRCLRADGTWRWMRTEAKPERDADGAIVAWHGLSVEIDEEKRVEAALQSREATLQRLIDTVPALIWRASPEGEANYFSGRLREYIGVRPEDFPAGEHRLEISNRQLFHPDDFEAAHGSLLRSLASGEPFRERFRLRRADGVYRWSEHRAEALRDEHGRIVEWYGVCLDIDDMVHVQEQLAQRERELRTLVDTIPAMLFSSPALAGPFFMSSHLIKYTGYVPEDFLAPGGTDPERFRQELMHPEDAPRVGETYARHFANGQPVAHRYRLRRADGAWRWVESRCASLVDETGTTIGRYGIMIDVDDEIQSQRVLRDTQERLASASQAASLSELSASIAHEVNQPLAAIIANAQACQNWLSAEPPNIARARTTAERVIGDANAVVEVVTRIRALFKRTPEPRATADINRLVSETTAVLREEAATRGLAIELRLTPDLPQLAIDRVQIQQVIANLARNGIEATPDGVDGASIVLETRRDGSDLLITVTDQGVGFADPNRAFDPFVTTKVNGMGMGLAIARSVVEAHEGRIKVAPTPPRGTAVTVSLPIEDTFAGALT